MQSIMHRPTALPARFANGEEAHSSFRRQLPIPEEPFGFAAACLRLSLPGATVYVAVSRVPLHVAGL